MSGTCNCWAKNITFPSPRRLLKPSLLSSAVIVENFPKCNDTGQTVIKWDISGLRIYRKTFPRWESMRLQSLIWVLSTSSSPRGNRTQNIHHQHPKDQKKKTCIVSVFRSTPWCELDFHLTDLWGKLRDNCSGGWGAKKLTMVDLVILYQNIIITALMDFSGPDVNDDR